MADCCKSKKSFQKVLKKYDFEFPGMAKIPRTAISFVNLKPVDIHIAKKKLELLNRIPTFDADTLRSCGVSDLGKKYMPLLVASGYCSVALEIKELLEEEKLLLQTPEVSGRTISFVENPELMTDLIEGLIECADSEKRCDSIIFPNEKVRLRKILGEKMATVGDYWLARKMFSKCFDYMESVDEQTDKIRVELWCLISYVCIYFEESQDVGFDLPLSCLSLAQNISRNKPWIMKRNMMNVLIPSPLNVYGLKNEWVKIKSEWVIMYGLVTTLLHILEVKKARYWQNQLNKQNCDSQDASSGESQSQPDRIKIIENVHDALTTALAYADEVRQVPAFIATTLRRGLFLEEIGEVEKAVEDYNALHTLCKNFEEKEALAMTLNRLGHYELSRGNIVKSLDNFVQELNISRECNSPELASESMKDVGTILLQEGHTWEAEECFSYCSTFNHDNRNPDTPKEVDDISWALLGVSRGQHLWGRYAALARSNDRAHLKSINEWRSLRKPLPPAILSEKTYKTQNRDEILIHYSDINAEGGSEEGDDNQRRLFEFTKEIKSKQSVWFRNQGFQNEFEYIKASDKPRDVPAAYHEFMVQFQEAEENDNEAAIKEKQLKTLAKVKSFALSLKKSMNVHPEFSMFSQMSFLLNQGGASSRKATRPSLSLSTDQSTSNQSEVDSFFDMARESMKSHATISEKLPDKKSTRGAGVGMRKTGKSVNISHEHVKK